MLIRGSLDRLLGLVTTFVIGAGSFAYMVARLRRLRRGDAFHESRFGPDEKLVEHHGSCHCRAVHFTVRAPARIRALDCATKIRYPHCHVPQTALLVQEGHDKLSKLTERCGPSTSTCFFCSSCGEQ